MIRPPLETVEGSEPPRPSELSYQTRSDGASRAHALVTRLLAEMGEGWASGERPTAELHLERHPELLQWPEAAVWLVYEEFKLRRKYGPPMSASEVARRYPRWRTALGSLLDSRQPGRRGAGAPLFPGSGEMLVDYELLEELGRGFLGRVFLARQTSLADRPVVLKVTPRDGREHLTLARLQHTHIVPLYAAHDLPERDLRVLCMPYLGGVTLDQVLGAVRGTPAGERTGREVLEVLVRAGAATALQIPPLGALRPPWARLDFAGAACWLAATLADALHYAHERGLLHLDIKPSNILIAADGQPMLLDFHLAQGPIVPGQEGLERLGGTPGYMSPEQSAVMSALYDGRANDHAVDARSDVFSLGAMLFEALEGCPPADYDGSARQLPGRNRQVSVGLADILARCLRRDPRDRYESAAELASDLRRHLADLPLRGVPNRSPGERWRKWRRRRPHAPALIAVLALSSATALAGGLFAWSEYTARVGEAEAALAQGREQLGRRDYVGASAAFEDGLRRLAPLAPAADSVRRDLLGQLARARRARDAEGLRRFVDQIRFRYGEGPLPGDLARELERNGRRAWGERARLVAPAGAPNERVPEEPLRNDLLDLALFTADLAARNQAGEQGRRDALAILAEAEALFGPNVVLESERRRLAAAGRGETGAAVSQSAPALAPRTAWEHYGTGRSLLAAGELAPAVDSFAKAVDLEPRAFWPNFYQGVCDYRLGRYDDAVAAFRACVVLAPESAECYYNLGLARAALGRLDRALADYGQALRLSPRMPQALLNRGILLLRLGRYAEAASDLRTAREAGADPAQTDHYLRLALQGRRPTDAPRPRGGVPARPRPR